MRTVACVIPAAGWGSVCPVRSGPKVLETTGDELMIERIIRTVLDTGLNGPLVVVVGSNGYGQQIREALAGKSYPQLQIVVQAERRGAADAVRCALPYIGDATDVLVTFGDMPLWRSRTLQKLVDAHLLQDEAVISMVTLKLQPGHRTERYGRIARDAQGAILAAFEPSELDGRELAGVAMVNPSLYVIDREWLTENLSLIPAVDKGDGFHPELHLPKLLPIAHDQGATILEVPLEDASEALGVNTAEELDEVRRFIKIHREIEEIARFVGQYRSEHAIVIGQAVDWMPQESETGFYLFAQLPRHEEYTGPWLDLYESDTRWVTLSRVRFERSERRSTGT